MCRVILRHGYSSNFFCPPFFIGDSIIHEGGTEKRLTTGRVLGKRIRLFIFTARSCTGSLLLSSPSNKRRFNAKSGRRDTRSASLCSVDENFSKGTVSSLFSFFFSRTRERVTINVVACRDRSLCK